MAVTDVLVCIDPIISGEGRLKLAVDIARAHRAYLSACYIMPRDHGVAAGSGSTGTPINPSPGVFIAPQVVTAAASPLDLPISREAEHAEQVEQLFRSELRRHRVEGEWHLLSPGEAAALIDLAKSFDLTILGQLSPETRSSAFRPDEIIVASGRPILVVPYAATFDTVGRRALVPGTGPAKRRAPSTTRYRCLHMPRR